MKFAYSKIMVGTFTLTIICDGFVTGKPNTYKKTFHYMITLYVNAKIFVKLNSFDLLIFQL